MAKTQEYKLSSDGLKTTVTDTTVWGGENGLRSSYAIVFGLLKYSTSGFSPCSLAGSAQVNLLDENPSFVFNNQNDGYYVVRAIYAGIDTAPSVEGSVYYDTTSSQLFLYTSGSFSAVSYTQLLSYGSDLLDEVKSDIGISASLEKMMDKIWYSYYVTGQVHKGREYEAFQILYSLLIGGRSTLLEGSYAEFDRVISNASTIALRKLKEYKIQ